MNIALSSLMAVLPLQCSGNFAAVSVSCSTAPVPPRPSRLGSDWNIIACKRGPLTRRAGVAVGERGVCVCVCEGRAGALGWRCRARAGPSVGLFLTPRVNGARTERPATARKGR